MTRDKAILDFGSGRISVLIGKRGVNGTLRLSGCHHEKYAGFEGGQWFKPDLLASAVTSAIKAAENEAGIKIKHLYIGVPAEFSACVVRDVTLSFARRHKITDADVDKLFQQGMDFCDEAVGYTLINRQPIYFTLDDERRIVNVEGQSSARLNGLLSYVLAENKFTFLIDNILEGLNLDSAEYVSSPLACATFLLDDFKRDRCAVLVDIGYITTNVGVVRGDGFLSLGSFSLGGGHIAGDFAKYFGTSFADAESLKRKVDLSLQPEGDDVYEVGGREYPADEVNKIVLARLNYFAKAIEKCLNRCKYEIPSSAQYYLTGGGIGFMRGAKSQLGKILGREIELAVPPMPQMESPDLSSCLGLLNMVLDADEPQQKKKGIFAKIFG